MNLLNLHENISILFLLYGLYRGVGKPGISIVLTVIYLGSRVFLVYFLSTISSIGVLGISFAIPIGWVLADVYGICYYCINKEAFIEVLNL